MYDTKEIIDLLLDNGAQSAALNWSNETAFHSSCKAGAGASALKILKMGVVADINARNTGGCTAMALACRAGLREVVVECLRRGASLTEEWDNERNSLLHAACAGNQGEMAVFLINNGASPGGRGIFPNKAGLMPFDLIKNKEVKKDLQKAQMEFQAAGGLTGLRLRRKDAERAINLAAEQKEWGPSALRRGHEHQHTTHRAVVGAGMCMDITRIMLECADDMVSCRRL